MLSLGVIGLNEGNGHPYSWSAIFNGFNPARMAECEYPVIPQYLSKRNYPSEFLAHLGTVTHVWCDNEAQARKVSAASKIPNVCSKPEDLFIAVDAILLARDDYETRRPLAHAAVRSGKPIFIDKPLCVTEKEARDLFQMQRSDWQIYTCSSLKYGEWFELKPEDGLSPEKVERIEAFVPKSWNTYAIHVIEPLLGWFDSNVTVLDRGIEKGKSAQWIEYRGIKNTRVRVHSDTGVQMPIQIQYHGGGKSVVKRIDDPFIAFRESLSEFVRGIAERKRVIPLDDTIKTIRLIEKGLL